MEGPHPPPQSHSGSLYPPLTKKINRFKPVWRVLLISNLALGAYMFAKARQKNLSIQGKKEAKGGEEEKTSVKNSVDTEETVFLREIPSPPPVMKPKEPIPEDQQRKLFKWILEEKRKVIPKDPEEKKQIDEEKAILKQFIRAKSIPPI